VQFYISGQNRQFSLLRPDIMPLLTASMSQTDIWKRYSQYIHTSMQQISSKVAIL